MKQWIAISVCASALLAFNAPSAASPTVRAQQIKFANALVAALQSGDRARVIPFFHPAVRACIDDRTRPFFDSVVDEQLKGFPSGKYSSIDTTSVSAKSTPSLWAFLPEKAFPYPVMPTYDIQVKWDSTPDGMFIDMLEAAPSGASWYLVTACPNADGMRLTRTMLAQKARQVARGKELASKVHGALLEQIKKLLAAHDRLGAAQAYQKATGSDLTTAASVVDAIEDPHE